MIITALGVASIVMASLGLIVNGIAMLFAWILYQTAATGAPAGQQALSNLTTPSHIIPAAGEFVPPRGFSAEQRRIVIEGLSHAQPISPARGRQLDALLAEAGRQIIRLSDDNLTVDRVASYPTNVLDQARISGGASNDLFMLPTGRLQLSDSAAVFFPTGSPSGIRVEGGSFTDASGTHLSADQINAIVDQVKQRVPMSMNPPQAAALQTELQLPAQTLITPSPSVTQAVAQVAGVQVLNDGTVAITTTNGNSVSLGVDGRSSGGIVPISAMKGARPRVPRGHVVLFWFETLLSLACGCFLMAAGIVILRSSPRSREMYLTYAIVKILLAGLASYATFAVWWDLTADHPDNSPLAMMIMLGMSGVIFPVIVLVIINLRSVREYLAMPTVHRYY